MQIKAKKTKVDLVTGFLGAGKTTFILDYASELHKRGERIGIIENDFGAINVDLMLLYRELGDRCRLEMVIGGDPDCHRRRLKTKLIAMGIDRYDRVIVEPSGVFDVEEFSDILYEEPLDHLLELNNVITVADGEMLASGAYSESGRYLLAEQLTKAGMVLVSKAEDLAGSAEVNEDGEEAAEVYTEESPEDGIEPVETDTEEIPETGLDKILRYMNASLENVGCARRLGPEELILRSGSDASEADKGTIGSISDGDMERLLSAGHRDYAYRKQPITEDGTFSSLFFFHPELPEEPADELMKRIFADPSCAGLMRVKGFVRYNAGHPAAEWLEINATREHTELRPSPVGQPVLIAIGEGISEKVIGSYLRSYENEYRA